MQSKLLFTILFLPFLSSCLVQNPRYSEIRQVLKLQIGMSLEEVAGIMETPPYDLKGVSENGEFTYIYKYRVEELRRIPYVMNKNKGFKSRGKFVDLFVFFSKEGKVVQIESCSECDTEVEQEKKIDLNNLITALITTVPIIFLYLGLR